MSTFKVNATLASMTVAFALSHGLSIEDIDAAIGPLDLDLMDPETRLPEDILPRLWLAIAAANPSEALTLQMARAVPLSALCGLAHGAQFAVDLREALGLLTQSKALVADRVVIELHESETEAAIVVAHPLDVIDDGRTTEVGLGIIWRLIQEIVDIEVLLTKVELAFPRGSSSPYEEFFGAPISFDQPLNRLILPLETLAAPVNQANATLFDFARRHFEQTIRLLSVREVPDAMSSLRVAITENSSAGDFGVASAARRAHMSLRSAQRIAKASGTTLTAMVNDVRISSAKEFLRDSRTTVETIARFLGYSDDRAFRRAFKRSTGKTPSGFRESL